MARCKTCNTTGLFLTLDKNGVCKQCQIQIYPQLLRNIEIIKESEKIIQESKNYKTRLCRCDLIISTLQKYTPYEERGLTGLFNKSIPECIHEIECRRNSIIAETITSTYEDVQARVKMASSTKTKINACNNGILKLRELAKDFGHRPEIEKAARELKKHAHFLEYKSFIDLAQKAEFKSDFKKALDQYQEALYFLKNDEINDSEQKIAISNLENKIYELKNHTQRKINQPKITDK